MTQLPFPGIVSAIVGSSMPTGVLLAADPRYEESRQQVEAWLSDFGCAGQPAPHPDYEWCVHVSTAVLPYGLGQRRGVPGLLEVFASVNVSEFRSVQRGAAILLDLATNLSFFGLDRYTGIEAPLTNISLVVNLSTHDLRSNDVWDAMRKLGNAAMYTYWVLRKVTASPEPPEPTH